MNNIQMTKIVQQKGKECFRTPVTLEVAQASQAAIKGKSQTGRNHEKFQE